MGCETTRTPLLFSLHTPILKCSPPLLQTTSLAIKQESSLDGGKDCVWGKGVWQIGNRGNWQYPQCQGQVNPIVWQ